MACEVFISYAHKDKRLLERLAIHLKSLEHQELIATWYDGEITPGAEWNKQILDHLNAAQFIILLISPDFIASQFCYSIEMQQAIARHEISKPASFLLSFALPIGNKRPLQNFKLCLLKENQLAPGGHKMKHGKTLSKAFKKQSLSERKTLQYPPSVPVLLMNFASNIAVNSSINGKHWTSREFSIAMPIILSAYHFSMFLSFLMFLLDYLNTKH